LKVMQTDETKRRLRRGVEYCGVVLVSRDV